VGEFDQAREVIEVCNKGHQDSKQPTGYKAGGKANKEPWESGSHCCNSTLPERPMSDKPEQVRSTHSGDL